jgi:UDP-N-acetylmuramoyl-tripeptide--D-alanyl-D-alanine ligase
LGIEVVAVATADYGPPPVPDSEAAVAALGPLDNNTAVLVKASRAAGLEAVADALSRG